MLTIKDVFVGLSTGDVLQMVPTGKMPNTGQSIQEESYPKLINIINRGIRDLALRFPLLEREVTIQQYDELAFYELDRRFAQTNKESDVPIKYIADSQWNPFTDDVLAIHNVHDEVGRPLPLNDYTDPSSVFIVGSNRIMVPYPLSTNAMFVMYRALPPLLDDSTTDLSAQVYVPDACLQALIYYVTSVLYMTSSNTDKQNLGRQYQALYNQEAQKMIANGSVKFVNPNSNIQSKTKGWV